MIQVLGLRERLDRPAIKREVFFGKNWRFDSVQDVFNIEKLTETLAKIPTAEHYNLYFTVADCFEERGRKLKEQWVIPFDIDDIHIESETTIERDALKVADAALSAIGLDYKNCGVIFSGHGVQMFVLLDKPILSEEYFDSVRHHYAAVSSRMQAALLEKGLAGKVDTSVFSKARLMRLPNTENRKPDKPTRTAVILNSGFAPHGFDIIEASGIKYIEKAEVLADQTLKNYPKPDSKAVCTGCAFLKWCKDSPGEVMEPQWYAMLSITARLDNGRELSHEYSQGHPGYTHYEAELKIDQALQAAGPRTCKNIDALWGKCSTCEYSDKGITSPIMIRGANFIASSDFGFRKRKITADGRVVAGPPEFGDLIKQFELEHPFKVIAESGEVCIFNGKHWEVVLEAVIKNWMRHKVHPHPASSEMVEFCARLRAEHVISRESFTNPRQRKLNFNNCVLDIVTGDTHAHAPEFGFFNVLPIDYDKYAAAPTWEKFLLDISNGNPGMAEVLEEFGGYCISGDTCWLQKALLLVGEGANGKSTLMETLGNVVGEDNRETVPFQELTDKANRYLLINKLFNYSEETSHRAVFDSSSFKNLVTGGFMTVKQLYVQPFTAKNNAKFILSLNELPHVADQSHGFFRRFIIVKFERQFNEGDPARDPHLQAKLNKELAGICNRLLAAYKRLKLRGVITDAYDHKANLEEFMIESSNVSRFCIEFVTPKPNEECSATDVYDSYRAYCENNGEKPLNSNAFSRILHRQYPQLTTVVGKDATTRRSFKKYRGITVEKEF